MNHRTPSVRPAQLLTLVLLFGCGGGGGGGGSSGAGGIPVFSAGPVTGLGSVVVNGIKFEDASADIAGDDSFKALADIRKIGVVLRIRGRLDSGGRSGTADRIEIENEVRGPIASITLPDAFTVLGQTVVVGGGTVFDDTTGLAGADPLAVSDVVEVHGERDAAGQVRATRVERLGAPGVDELRGVITARTGTTSGTVTIGGSAFAYDAATVVVPAGAAFGAGTLVEVHLAGTLITRLEVEDLDEAQLQPSEGMESQVEGFVSGFIGLGVPFFVAGQEVDASGAGFENGVPADLANNVRVEAEGSMSGGVLVAEKIEFKDSIRIQSVVQSGAVNAGGTGTFQVLGLTVFVTSVTLNSKGAIATGDSLELRGFLNADGLTITATRIDAESPIDPDKHFIQGLVTSKNPATLRFTILGIEVNAAGWNDAGGGVEFQDSNDSLVTPSAFFAAVLEGATVAKARGTPGAGTLTATEVEIE